MILRLIVAFTRWAWGISPAFVTADSETWYIAMYFGALVDVAVVTILIVVLVNWMQERR